MKEFSKLNYSAFICLRNKIDSGYPYRSNIADLFLDSMSTFNRAELTLISIVKSIIDFVNEIKENNKLLNDQEIAEEFSKYKPWCNGYQDKSTKFQENVKNLFDEYLKYDQNEVRNKIKEIKIQSKNDNKVLSKKRIPVFILIDEAHELLDQSSQLENGIILKKFQVMARSIMKVFVNFPIVFVLTSTKNKISNFFSNPSTLTSSSRIPSFPIYPPFFKIFFIDELITDEYKNILNENVISKSFNYEYLYVII